MMTYPLTAYKAVFGQDYNQHIKCSVSEAHKCKTIEESICVPNDPRLVAVTKDLFFIDDWVLLTFKMASTTSSGINLKVIQVKNLKVM